MKFKLGVIALILGVFLSISPTMISAKTESVGVETKSTIGWKNVKGTWYYYNASGVKQTGWLKEGNAWYYLKSNGAMATGWEKVNETWYYLQPSGAMKTGWLKEGSTWYYLKPSGAMATGWEKVNGTWYYLQPSGAMKTGWLKDGSTWYYLKPSGAMATGWEKVNGTWYYLQPSGAMKTGWLKEGSTWYYLKPGGAMATGWEKVNNVWYYFYNSGAMATNTVIDGWSINGNGVATNQQPIDTVAQVLKELSNEGFYVSPYYDDLVFWSGLVNDNGMDIDPIYYDVYVCSGQVVGDSNIDISITISRWNWGGGFDDRFAYTKKALNKVIPSGTSTIMNAVSNVKSGTWKFDGRTVNVWYESGFASIDIYFS